MRIRFVVRSHTALATSLNLSHRSCMVMSPLPEEDKVGEEGGIVKEIPEPTGYLDRKQACFKVGTTKGTPQVVVSF